jgi:cobalt/nickel transport system permease protein
MRIEEFALGDSFIHRLDPRAKIIAAFSFSLVTALTQSIPASVAALVFASLLVTAAKLNPGRVLARLAVVNGFILFLWVFLPFTYPGEVIFSLGPLEVHRAGVLLALLITLKSNAIIAAVMALLGTSPVFALVHALSRMGVPDKLVHLFFFTFRYLHLIHEEYHRLVRAMKVRGFRPGTDLHTYRSYAYLMGMLLVRSFDRAGRILAAMKCRGFKRKFYILQHYEMKRSDYLAAATCVLFSVMLLGV